MEQNKLSYAISRLEGDAFAQIELYVSAENSDFENINQFVEVLKTRFGEVNLVDTAKHELYQLYQINKDLEVFLNTFLQLSKKVKIDDSQALDMLYKKLSDELKRPVGHRQESRKPQQPDSIAPRHGRQHEKN